MEKLTREWEELKSFLPSGWEEKAKEGKVICRPRKVSGAEELLHFGEELSLKETSYDGDDNRVELLPLLRELSAGEVLDI